MSDDRDARVESYYDGWSARDMAERIVELEDSAHRVEGDGIGLSEELDEARAANVELSGYARDAGRWEAVADRMRVEIFRLQDLLRVETARADAAILREDAADAEVEELKEELTAARVELEEVHRQRSYQREEDAGRIALLRADVERLKRDLRVSEARVGGAALHVDRVNAHIAMLENVVTALDGVLGERDRYRSAWLSARRRATRESAMAGEAVAHLSAERNLWRQRYERLRDEVR